MPQCLSDGGSVSRCLAMPDDKGRRPVAMACGGVAAQANCGVSDKEWRGQADFVMNCANPLPVHASGIHVPVPVQFPTAACSRTSSSASAIFHCLSILLIRHLGTSASGGNGLGK
jgi:hypothetical protein